MTLRPADLPEPTVADKTPYGQSEAFGTRAFRRTCWWVCPASAQRMAHLALIPRSPASRRFVFWVVLWVACSAAMLQFGLVGWHTVTNAPRDETAAAAPTGRGWYHLVQANPSPLYRGQAVPTAVWWNPPQGILAAANALVVALIFLGVFLAAQRAGARHALGPVYSGQGRLEAALHYGTAWLLLMFPAAFIAMFGRVADITVAARWPVAIPSIAVYAPAVVVALISVTGYTFGLIRVAATVPVAVRARVMFFFAFWNPLMMACCVSAAAAGLQVGTRWLVPQLNLGW